MRTSLHMLKRGMFNLIEGDFIGRYAQAYGEWSNLEVRFLLNNLCADSNVVEVGSNIGMHAIPIARHIERGKLFCFEPQRVIFQTFCAPIYQSTAWPMFTPIKKAWAMKTIGWRFPLQIMKQSGITVVFLWTRVLTPNPALTVSAKTKPYALLH